MFSQVKYGGRNKHPYVQTLMASWTYTTNQLYAELPLMRAVEAAAAQRRQKAGPLKGALDAAKGKVDAELWLRAKEVLLAVEMEETLARAVMARDEERMSDALAFIKHADMKVTTLSG